VGVGLPLENARGQAVQAARGSMCADGGVVWVGDVVAEDEDWQSGVSPATGRQLTEHTGRC
jgi:hypothetical protein